MVTNESLWQTIKTEWWFRVSRKLNRDYIYLAIVKRLPHRLLYWAYIRVVANTVDGAPSPETIKIMCLWESQEHQ